MDKLKSWQEIKTLCQELRQKGKRIVFTNGCFDILHKGHIVYLREAKALGDVLIVGLNSDSSIRRLKGETRPVNSERDRADLLNELISINYIVIFKEDTPYDLINNIKPDVLVKGGDWKEVDIVGSDIVKAHGGEVISLNFVEGYSTSEMINRMNDGK